MASVAVALSIPTGAAAQSLEERTAARRVLERWQDAVVNVRVVLKMRVSVGGREMQSTEETVETVATVLDPSGLAVMSLASLNPGGLIKKMMGSRMSAQEGPGFDIVSEPTDVRIRLTDATEIAAKIALRDEDLDLAFIRPTSAPARPLASLAEAEAGRPATLDPLVIVSRLGAVGGWGPAASLQHVQAVVEKPRPMYVAQPGGVGGLGTPAFTLDGKLAGFVVIRSVTGDRSGMFSFMSGNPEGLGLLPIVLPAAAVREVAKQAKP